MKSNSSVSDLLAALNISDESVYERNDSFFDVIYKCLNDSSFCELSSWSSFYNKDGNEWIKVITYIKTVITSIGLLANLTTFVSLILNGDSFPLIGRILLIHQATVDTFICMMAIGIYNQPFMWYTDNVTFDFLVCQVWHGQAIYWGAVLLSVWNVVMIAFERFILLNHPVKHRNLQQNIVYKTLAFAYFLSIICLLPAYFFVTYKHNGYYGKCYYGYYISKENGHKEWIANIFKKFMMFYGVFWFFIVYAIPIGILITLYTKIILKLRQRRNRKLSTLHVHQEPDIIELAQRQITKTAVAISIVFIISLSWESFYCLLGFTKVIPYEFNKLPQVIGIFLATLCSSSTPFIYAASMPIFRKSLKKTFRCRTEKKRRNSRVCRDGQTELI